MQNWMLSGLLLMLLVITAGCGIEANRKMLARVRPGMSEDRVVEIMGEPARIETHHGYTGETYTVLRYHTNWDTLDPEQDFAPVVVQNGRVIGIGNKYWNDKKLMKVDRGAELSTSPPAGW